MPHSPKWKTGTDLDGLNAILDAAGLGSWDWWLPTGEVYFDHRWCEMLGLNYETTEQNFTTWDTRVHPDDRERSFAEIKRCLESPSGHYENLHRLRHENGSWIWILSRGRVSQRDPEGKPMRITGTHFDMTAYKEAEEINNSIQAIASIGGWELDLNTQKTRWTEETYRIHGLLPGLPTDKILGLSFYAAHEQGRLQEYLAQCIAGVSFRSTLKFYDAGRRKKWVEVMGKPIFNAAGKAVKVRGTIQDVTKLVDSEHQLEEAQAVAKIGSWKYDVGSRTITWSRQMYNLFDENPQSGPPSFERHVETIHPEDRPHWHATVEKCVTDGRPYRMRFRSIFPNKVLWIEAQGQGRLDEHGQIQSISGTCQDVSELVEAEERAKRERAKALQNAKLVSLGEMSAGIAHEINNPLAIVASTLQNMSRWLNDPQRLAERLKTVEKAVERIAKVVRGLRKFSRSHQSMELKRNSLSSIVNEAVNLSMTKAQRHGTTVTVIDEAHCTILCDELEIEQVLLNLINNGIDAVQHLKDRWVKIELTQSGNDAIIRVTDSGQGISPDIQAKLFEPFFTTKPVGEGTGLGLAIVKGILDEHKATIELINNKGHTCFEIRFNKTNEVRLGA